MSNHEIDLASSSFFGFFFFLYFLNETAFLHKVMTRADPRPNSEPNTELRDINNFFFQKTKIFVYRSGVLKLWISPFLMDGKRLKFENQMWRFMRCDILAVVFWQIFSKYIFLEFGSSSKLKIGLG